MELQLALLNWNSKLMPFELPIPNPFYHKPLINSLPRIFIKFRVHSIFIVNFWDEITFLLLVLVMFWMLYTTTHLLSNNHENTLFFTVVRSAKNIIQNFIWTLLYNTFGDVIFFSILSWRALDMSNDYVSYIASLIFITIIVASFIHHIRIIITYQSLKNTDQLKLFIQKNQGSRVLFTEFKDQTFHQQSFLFFFTIRDIMISLMLSNLFDYPFIGAAIYFVLVFPVLIYLITKKPFQSTLEYTQIIFYEVLSLIVTLQVLLMAIYDDLQILAEGQRKAMGKIIIVIHYTWNIATILFFIVRFLIELRKIYISLKVNRVQHDKQYKNQNLSTSSIPINNSTTLENNTFVNNQNDFLVSSNQSKNIGRINKRQDFRDLNQDPIDFIDFTDHSHREPNNLLPRIPLHSENPITLSDPLHYFWPTLKPIRRANQVYPNPQLLPIHNALQNIKSQKKAS